MGVEVDVEQLFLHKLNFLVRLISKLGNFGNVLPKLNEFWCNNHSLVIQAPNHYNDFILCGMVNKKKHIAI